MTDMATIRTMMMVSEVHTYVKTYQIVHFKYIRFSAWKFYLSKAVKKKKKKRAQGDSHFGVAETNLVNIHEHEGSISGLTG